MIFVWLYRLFPSLLEAAIILKPPELEQRALSSRSGPAGPHVMRLSSSRA
jgi:hypothetical protein